MILSKLSYFQYFFILQYISQERKNIANKKKFPILCSPSLNLTENMLLIRFDSIYELKV